MADLTTRFLGLTLRNPLIVGSSGLTDSVEKVKEIEQAGAGAVVLKSLFEEEIIAEMEETLHRMTSRQFIYPETFDYMDEDMEEDSVRKYLRLVQEAKAAVHIPVIASINCVSAYDWSFFSKRIQEAGADAIELNIFILPSDVSKSAADYDEMYKKIIADVKQYVSIPISLKLSYYSSSLVKTFIDLSKMGIAGMVLFNKPYNPDINIDLVEVATGKIFSSSNDYARSLRWTALLSGRVDCDLAASTGVKSSETVVKMLLAGSTAVQVASVLYEKGIEEISNLVTGLNDWMDVHSFKTIDEFRGKLSQINLENPAVFERVQFMKSFAKIGG